MKKLSVLASAILAGALLLVPAAPVAAAPLVCDAVSGVPGDGVCEITTLKVVSGTVTVDRALRISGPAGELRVTAGGTLNLEIDGTTQIGLNTYGLIIQTGGKITGDGAANTTGATLNILVKAGDVVLAASGAFITSDNTRGLGCEAGSGGTVNLTAAGTGANITTEDGTTISASGLNTTKTGLGTCSAGAINISAPNEGSIDIDGDVLAESGRTGNNSGGNFDANPPIGGTQRPGGGPIFIDAACDLTISDTGIVSSRGLDPGADLVHLEGGCDVLINGLVQSTGPGHSPPGQPPNSCSNVVPFGSSIRRNPTTRPGKPSRSTACVEVWAGNSLTILRDIEGHNGEINADLCCGGGSQGESWIDLFVRGDLTILSAAAPAVHANGAAGNSDNGGTITAKSRDGEIVMSGFALQATGTIIGGTLDVAANLDVDLSDVKLEARGGTGNQDVKHGGHVFVQSFNEDIASNVASLIDVTGNVPSDGTVDLTACGTIGFPPGTIAGASVVNKTTGACGGQPSFPTEYDVILPACPCETSENGDCEKAPVNAVLNPATGRFQGNLGPDDIVRLDLGETVQDAVTGATDLNGDDYIIVLVVKDDTGTLGGQTDENVLIDEAYADRFALIGCSVTIRAEDPGLPAGHIATTASSPAGSPENIFVMDLHGANSDFAGWLVQGDGRYMRNVANKDNQTGIQILGNNNVMHNGNAVENAGVGMLIQGNGNKAMDTDLFDNGGLGAEVTGDANVLLKLDVGDRGKGNGAGVLVSGNSNQVLELDVYANAGDGIVVTGNSNTIKKNGVGERGKGNSGDGIRVDGSGNQVLENEAKANTGDGLDVTAGTAVVAQRPQEKPGRRP